MKMKGALLGTFAATAALAAALGSPLAAHAEYLGYPDMSEGAGQWYVDSGVIDWSEEHGAVHGFPDGRWAPDRVISRAEAAAVLHNLAGNPEAATPPSFTDSDGLGWAYGSAAWAEDEGIFTGNAQTGAFEPWGPLTREQAAKVLCAYAGGAEGDGSALGGYPDASSVSPWARGVMSWAVGAGVIGGRVLPGGTFLAGQGACTRAEFAGMLAKTVDGAMRGVDLSGKGYEADRSWVKDYREVEVPVYEDRWVADVQEGWYDHVYCLACGYGVYIPWDIAIDNMYYNHPEWYKKFAAVISHVQHNDCGDDHRGQIGVDWGTKEERVWHREETGTGHWEKVQVGTKTELVEDGGHWEFSGGRWV